MVVLVRLLLPVIAVPVEMLHGSDAPVLYVVVVVTCSPKSARN